MKQGMKLSILSDLHAHVLWLQVPDLVIPPFHHLGLVGTWCMDTYIVPTHREDHGNDLLLFSGSTDSGETTLEDGARGKSGRVEACDNIYTKGFFP